MGRRRGGWDMIFSCILTVEHIKVWMKKEGLGLKLQKKTTSKPNF